MTEAQEVYRDVLNEGYALHWYEVKSVLGRGSFGVTYLAKDKNLDQLVAIKEYFPRDFSSRAEGSTVHPTTGAKKELYEWGLVRFVREAQTLAKFKHNNIVRVMSVFELNNTAYMVMEYEQGEELSKVYKRKKHLTEKELLDIFLPIMDGLKLVHDAGFIHRDIKPANIFIRADGSPVLIDFGAARKTIGTPTRTVTSLVTYGYAPFEQYNESEEKQGAWTDIYALGACLYLAVTGKLPQDSLSRGSSLLSNGVDPYEPASNLKNDNYSPGFLRAIDHALMFKPQARPQDIRVWAGMLNGSVEVPPLPDVMFQSLSGDKVYEPTIAWTTPPDVSARGDDSLQPVSKPVTKPAKIGTPELQKGSRWWNTKHLLPIIIVLLLGVGGILFYIYKPNPPNDIEKQHQITSLIQTANDAYQAGNLLDKKAGALRLYQKILKLDPANTQASKRVKEIIELSSDGIRSDLAEGFYERAQSHFQLLQDAAPDSTGLLALREELQRFKTTKQDIANLLSQAEINVKAGRLLSPKENNALFDYRRILEKSPDNPEAKRGIDNILTHYIELAQKNLATGKLDEVKNNIADILSIDPESTAAQDLRSKMDLRSSQRQQQQTIRQLLREAQHAFKSGNLINPANHNALALYRRVLDLDKANAKAIQGIKQVKKKQKAIFETHFTAGKYTSAEKTLQDIERVFPDSALARDVRSQWANRKFTSQADADIINDMLGQFKQRFESRDVNALRNMSEFQTNRQEFLLQLLSNYTSYKIRITDTQFIAAQRKGSAMVSIIDLVNIDGAKVEPGQWSRFKILIHRNTKGQWKVYW